MEDIAIIKFPIGDIKIQLLDTPIVNQWKKSLKVYNEKNISLSYHIGNPFFSGSPSAKEERSELENTDTELVNNINKAINRFNEVTWGYKFPYEAFVGMPWEQTNLIHRCFTMGSTSLNYSKNTKKGTGILTHNLLPQQLKDYKNFCHNEKYYIQSVTDHQFHFHLDDREIVRECLNLINMYVHLYEDRRFSPQAEKVYKDTIKDINIGWDYFDEKGGKTFFHCERPSNEDIKNSIPDNWYEYDVFTIKSIKGKDYETSFINNDNPLEWDTTNCQDITGGVRIFLNNSVKDIYFNPVFKKWLDDVSLDPHHYAPVPLGKIISPNFDFNQDEKSYTQPKILLSTDPNPKFL